MEAAAIIREGGDCDEENDEALDDEERWEMDADDDENEQAEELSEEMELSRESRTTSLGRGRSCDRPARPRVSYAVGREWHHPIRTWRPDELARSRRCGPGRIRGTSDALMHARRCARAGRTACVYSTVHAA